MLGQVACYLDDGGEGRAGVDGRRPAPPRRRPPGRRRATPRSTSGGPIWSTGRPRRTPVRTSRTPGVRAAHPRPDGLPGHLRPGRAAAPGDRLGAVHAGPGRPRRLLQPVPDGAGRHGPVRGAAGHQRRRPQHGDDDECPFEGSLTVDGESRAGCSAPQHAGDEIIVWSNRPLAIQTEATIAEGATVAEFWDWWTTAGPS